jgi:hypothetical protein
MTNKFLEFVHYDQGGRIFTYVITLDGQWRFTETGKEFGIDLLSKHTMHSDVSNYIAFSGEFFVRKLRVPPPSKEEREESLSDDKPDDASIDLPAPEVQEQNSPSQSPAGDPNKDPRLYELIIDNDSGTYRPNAKKLHVLREFMEKNLVGLKVRTLDCQADQEKMNKMKNQQRDRKKQGGQMMYQQNLSNSSISSSDEEKLERRAAGVDGGSMRKKKDQIRQKTESIMPITNGQAGGAREDGVLEGNEAAVVEGDTHHKPLAQEEEPAVNERTDARAFEADERLQNGERSEKVSEQDHSHPQGKQEEQAAN